MTRRILVIGASGQIGEQLLLRLPGAVGTSFSNFRPGLEPLDIRDGAALDALIGRVEPGLIFVPAFCAAVDQCELDPAGTRAINVDPVPGLLAAADRAGARLVYFSSDYVFDGTKGPYTEADPPCPINEYGRQKLQAERLIGASRRHLILRTTVVYGPETAGKNFVCRLAAGLRAGKNIRVPNDQIGSPTYAPNLAEAAAALAQSGAAGLFHLCGPDQVDRLAFAREAAAAFGLDGSLLSGVATPELGQPARRPLNAGMSAEKARSILKIPLIGYREGLRLTAAALSAAPKLPR